jgi:TnpA family transposase
LNRIAYAARAQVNAEYFRILTQPLSSETKVRLEALLTTKGEQGKTDWHRLKSEPTRPSVKALQRFSEHTAWVQSLYKSVGPLPDIPDEKRRQFVLEARAYPSDRMRALQSAKRMALLALLVQEQLYCCTDFLIDFFIRELRKLHNRARLDLKRFQERAGPESETLIGMLRSVAGEMLTPHPATAKLDHIHMALDQDPEAVVSRCNQLIYYGYNNHLQCLSKRYTKCLRNALLDSLALLEVDHTAHGGDLLTCLKYIAQYRDKNLKTFAVSALQPNAETTSALVIDWISPVWHSVLFTELRSHRIHRFLIWSLFELVVLSEISKRFQSGDLFVAKSTKYDDDRKHLISWEQYERLVADFTEQVGLDANRTLFVSKLKSQFVATAQQLDAKMPHHTDLVLEQNRVSLKKRKLSSDPLPLKRVDQALRDHLGEIDIIDLLVETTHWVELDTLFGPISGHQTKLTDYKRRLVATLLCYGCNLGPTQTARSIKSLTRKQVAYLNLAHTREQDLLKATEKVINAYNEYDLPKHWGSGENASVDGTRFDLYEQNLLSEFHLRYGSYGGIGYYLVSDQYIALFSRFIPCGVREAMYLIDGILENESDIQPTAVQGDTHAQSTVIFGLAHLLGIKLMPRIKDINSLLFFKPDKRTRYQHIEALFSEGINYTLIRDHYRDMLRIAISIKEGKVTASTIARRLGSHGIRNSLYYAFRELGRVIRTQFLLEYIGDIELRETIHASTCKSEEFNHFIQWIFFFNNGEIQENLRYEQDKMIRFNHLVANLVILHNVNSMTRVLSELKKEGLSVTPEVLAGLSPYRTEHINLLGDYTIDTSKRPGKRFTTLN